MAEIRWTEEAALWLQKIFDYIAKHGIIEILGVFCSAMKIENYL